MSQEKKTDLSQWLESSKKAPAPAADKPSILVVDDDDGVLTAMKIALRERYNVRTCSVATDTLQHMDDQIDTVVLDIKMSGKDGFWVFSEIRTRYEDVPIIFNSAYQDSKQPNEIVNNYHPFGYIVKGEKLERLLRSIDSAVEYYRNLRAARAAAQGAPREPLPASAKVAVAPAKRSVLVVDDDPSTLDAVQMALRDRFDVVLAASAAEAVAKLESSDISAVLLDVRLRGEDGFGLHEEVRKRNPLVPIVFHTAYGYAKDPYEIMNSFRPFGYLTKTGDAARVQDMITKAVQHYERIANSREVVERLRNVQRQMKKVMSLLDK